MAVRGLRAREQALLEFCWKLPFHVLDADEGPIEGGPLDLDLDGTDIGDRFTVRVNIIEEAIAGIKTRRSGSSPSVK